MRFQVISLKQKEKVKRVMQTPAPNLRTAEYSTGLHSLSANFLPNSLLEESLFQTQKFKTAPMSFSYIQSPADIMFYTSLHLSSSLPSYGTNQQLKNSHLLPYPPTLSDQIASAVNYDPLLTIGDSITKYDKEYPENLMDPFVPGESSASKCQGSDYVKDGLTLAERLQLHKLSEELGIAINGEDENSRVNDIYEGPQVSRVPIIELDCDRNNSSSVARADGNNIWSIHRFPEAAAAQKQRIRWTTELHELFIDTVNKLDGPECATPKGILMHMNVDGLNIYHVKSHLQKYRLAKKAQELKHDKRASSSQGKMQASADIDRDSNINRDMQLEALRMQIDVQKLLHEQLQVQKELQLRIEQQGEQLRKIMEEQEKAGCSLLPINGLHSFTNSTTESEQPIPCPFDGTSTDQVESNTESSSSQPKDKASAANESEESRSHKRLREE